MRIIAADDERRELDFLVASLKDALPEAEIKAFRSVPMLLEYVKENGCEVAFLNAEMRGTNGIEVAKRILGFRPSANIIFTATDPSYALDAFGIHASGFITKPYTVDDVRRELQSLRYSAESSGVSVRTFGEFEVTVGGQHIRFNRSKSREILAYLVDRCGSGATKAELAAVIFPDREYSVSVRKQTQVYISELVNTLKSVDAANILIKEHNSIAIDPEKISCDLYELIGVNGVVSATSGAYPTSSVLLPATSGVLPATSGVLPATSGVYLEEYGWAEMTRTWLAEHVTNN